ncbi:MAG: hypothetical protein AAF928_12905 [Myxococcota bacterium]
MKNRNTLLFSFFLGALIGCSGDGPSGADDDGLTEGVGTGSATTASGDTTAAGGGMTGMGGASGTVGSTVGSGGAGGDAGTGGGPVDAAPDPELAGPYTTAVIDESFTVSSTGSTVDVHAVYPTAGPDAGPYPVVVLGRGFTISARQYDSYLDHLASFGYVALSVAYPTPLFGPNHVENAEELAAGLDWAAGHPTLGPIADEMNAGSTGHSLGGKLAVLAATFDSRIAAVIALDPVDGAMSCSPQNCPDVSALMPISIPTGFIGETTDATGGFQSCAPAAENFETFYAGTSSPSLSVEVLGANHVSFVDDLQTCGLACSFCNPATAMQEDVRRLSRAMMVAFFERHLRGDTRYDAFLDGAEAQSRYVNSGLAVILSK